MLISGILPHTLSECILIISCFAKQKKIEQDTFKYADAITGLSGAYLNIFNDLYEGRYSNKSYFIPTGVDDDYCLLFKIEKRELYNIRG